MASRIASIVPGPRRVRIPPDGGIGSFAAHVLIVEDDSDIAQLGALSGAGEFQE
jgi:hypothetical protein